MFELIAAIDVSEGRLGRLTPRGPVPVEAFGGDPLAAAASFVAAGIRRLHVVDMDLALRGVAENLGIIAGVAALGVPVQAGGGVRTADEVGTLLEAGADRVVLSSGALADRVLVTGLAERLGTRLAIGVEIDGDRIRSRGRRDTDLPLEATLDWLKDTAAELFVVTGIARVGRLSGPDLEGIRNVVSRGRPVLGAGGIAVAEDVHAVRTAGAQGAILGRAALEGSLDLAELVAELASP